MTPIERRQFILEQLEAQGRVAIKEMSTVLAVSSMTVRRDLKKLERAGRLRTVLGGAIPAATEPEGDDAAHCPMCHVDLPQRTQMVLHLTDGTHHRTCCAHCGLWALSQRGEQIGAALAPDFLYGQMLNAQKVYYLFAPDITICCNPTILAFGAERDAERFQRGFGGEVLTLNAALDALQLEMTLE